MATHTTLLDAKLLVRTLTSAQLTELQESLSARRLVLDGEAQFHFPRGSRVKFDAGRRGWIHGAVEGWKRGGKAQVQSTSGGKWTVGGSLLQAG